MMWYIQDRVWRYREGFGAQRPRFRLEHQSWNGKGHWETSGYFDPNYSDAKLKYCDLFGIDGKVSKIYMKVIESGSLNHVQGAIL